MSAPAARTSEPSTGELVEGLSFFPIALVVSATIFPGFILCIPGLLFVTVLILVPIVALAAVVLVVATVVASPFLVVRGVRALRERHVLSRLVPRALRTATPVR